MALHLAERDVSSAYSLPVGDLLVFLSSKEEVSSVQRELHAKTEALLEKIAAEDKRPFWEESPRPRTTTFAGAPPPLPGLDIICLSSGRHSSLCFSRPAPSQYTRLHTYRDFPRSLSLSLLSLRGEASGAVCVEEGVSCIKWMDGSKEGERRGRSTAEASSSPRCLSTCTRTSASLPHYRGLPASVLGVVVFASTEGWKFLVESPLYGAWYVRARTGSIGGDGSDCPRL